MTRTRPEQILRPRYFFFGVEATIRTLRGSCFILAAMAAALKGRAPAIW